MKRTLLTLLSSVVLAVTNPLGSGDITNSATVEVSTITAPILITPVDDSLTNNRFEKFSWNTSTPDASISHYTLYIDDIIVSSYIPHSTAIDGVISPTLSTPIPDGKHTWYVIAYSTGNTSATSETRTLYVDATIPIIILQAVDKNTMYWASNDPYTIPSFQDRHLTVTTKKPLLSGKVEALSNLKLSLICPPASILCQNMSIIINDPDGEWKHRFYGLIPNITYSAFLSATDAAGNSNIFPEFTITYTPTPLISLPFLPKPTPTPTPTTPATSPVPEPTELPKEVIELKESPPAPPHKLPDATPTPKEKEISTRNWTNLALFGLLLHLSMTAFGAGIRLKLLPNLLLILFWPFLKEKSNKINLTLSTILVYDPDNQKLLYTDLSNLQKTFSLKNQPMFLKATFPGYEPFSIILNTDSSLEPIILKEKPSKTLLEGLREFSLSTRSLALIFSMFTAVISLVFTVNLPALILLLGGLDLLYTEYIKVER